MLHTLLDFDRSFHMWIPIYLNMRGFRCFWASPEADLEGEYNSAFCKQPTPPPLWNHS